nr:MAG TPA: hypothetical protein [Caudoviricetes sp.]
MIKTWLLFFFRIFFKHYNRKNFKRIELLRRVCWKQQEGSNPQSILFIFLLEVIWM